MATSGAIRRLVFVAVVFIIMAASHTVRGGGVLLQNQVVKVAVDLVSLNVTVTDKKGRIVPGLGEVDFKVYEDDMERPISFFGTEDVAVSWGLVLDRSGSMESMIGEVQQAALNMMDQTSPGDDMFVMPFDTETTLASDFTSDRLRLRNSIANLYTTGHTALFDAVAFALQCVRRGQHAKKVLVVVTDGEDNDSKIQLERLLERVEEERDVMIYPVGLIESARLPWWQDKPRYVVEKASSLKHDLQKLAEITGAAARFPKNMQEGRNAVKEIVREVGHHYSIGYYPINRQRDGRWRNVKVEVLRQGKRDAGLVARTRTGYYAPAVE